MMTKEDVIKALRTMHVTDEQLAPLTSFLSEIATDMLALKFENEKLRAAGRMCAESARLLAIQWHMPATEKAMDAVLAGDLK